MPSRRESLFSSKTPVVETNTVPTRIKRSIDKTAKRLNAISSDAKMLCALRKVLTGMSDDHEEGHRYYIAGDNVEVDFRTDSPGAKPGEPGRYQRKGKFSLGEIFADGRVRLKPVSFSIAFHDSKNDLGMDDVDFDDPTDIEALPPSTVIG